MMSHPSVAMKLETQAVEERIGFRNGATSVQRSATTFSLGQAFAKRRKRIARSVVTLMARPFSASFPG